MSRVFLSPATLVGGSLAGAVLLAAWLGAFTSDEQPAAPPAATRRAILPVDADTRPAAPTVLPASPQVPAPKAPALGQVQSVSLAATCPSQALASPRGAGDGRFALEAALVSGAQVDPLAYVTVAREAAQHGRLRDAEVALLAACHLAEKASGSHSVALADLKTKMAQQYAALAASEDSGSARSGLLQRASTLLSESAITYSAALGRDASKTRLAEQRLASLRDPATLQRARAEMTGSDTRVMGAAPPSAAETRRAAPSRLISSDPELSQLERDMERLHAQASRVTRDPSGMQRRDSQALAQRDAACQDKACLLRWYAQRRSQLLDEF